MRRIILGVVAFGLVGVVLGWSPIAARAARLSPETDDLIAKRRPAPHYEQLFPRYVDLRATSQWRKQIGGGGNAFGHGLIYIKGACKAEDAAFPQLRRCEREAVSVDDPEQGVGVRVGRFFRNVNRVAVPGYDFFHNGNLDPGETLTQERLDETVNAAIAAGVVDGVDLHDGRGGEWTRGREAFVGQHSADTDFALTYARNVFCARVPLTEGQVDEMIAFLNDKNTDYATGEADHDRNLFWDNGVHTIRNALAAANICAPIGVWDVHIRSILDMAVPENEFVNLAILGAEGPLDSVRGDPCWRVARLHLDDDRRERGDAAGLLERLRELKAADGLEDRA